MKCCNLMFLHINRIYYFRLFGVFLAAAKGYVLEFVLFSLQMVFCRFAPAKSRPIHHHTAEYIFSGPLRSFDLFGVCLKKK